MEGSQVVFMALSSAVTRSRWGPHWHPQPLALAISLVQLHLKLLLVFRGIQFLVGLAARELALLQGWHQEWSGGRERRRLTVPLQQLRFVLGEYEQSYDKSGQERGPREQEAGQRHLHPGKMMEQLIVEVIIKQVEEK